MTALLMTGDQAEALIAQRRAAGMDARDEMWEGVYHVAPYASNRHSFVEIELAVLLRPLAMVAGLVLAGPLNIGQLDGNYRIPDLTVSDPNLDLSAASVESVRVAVEVLSPHDETFEKFSFYAAHHVDEILVADPDARTVQCWRLTGGSYLSADRSTVLGVSCADLAAAIAWPA